MYIYMYYVCVCEIDQNHHPTSSRSPKWHPRKFHINRPKRVIPSLHLACSHRFWNLPWPGNLPPIHQLHVSTKSHGSLTWGFPKIGGTPKWMVKMMENPIKNGMIWEYHYFWKHPHRHPKSYILSQKDPKGSVVFQPSIFRSYITLWG